MSTTPPNPAPAQWMKEAAEVICTNYKLGLGTDDFVAKTIARHAPVDPTPNNQLERFWAALDSISRAPAFDANSQSIVDLARRTLYP